MSRRVKAWIVLLVAGACICVAGVSSADTDEPWRLGTQAYSFNRYTFYEAVAKTKSVGLKYIEAYPGQKLSKEHGDAILDHNMPPALRLQVMEMLKEEGIQLVNYGVVSLPNDEDACRKVFNFARDMGIETIVSEPPEDAFDLIDKLCQEYRIGVAIHNHPKPSHYWNPDTVLKACEDHSKWIGACADTGHWMRSGINPVEAIKKLGEAGRIRSLHFKDLNEFGNPSAHDVIWGTGAGKAGAILAELAAQKFSGVFSIEYEYHWENSLPEIAGCVAWFNRTAADLGISRRVSLFNGQDLSEWKTNASSGAANLWTVGKAKVATNNPELLEKEEGVGDLINLTPAHGASQDLYSKTKFGDCRIEVEVMVPRGSNSGIYVMGEYEIQVLDSYGKMRMGRGDMGAIYGGFSPPVNASKKPGQWQQYVIEFRAPRFDTDGKKIQNAEFLKVELNGQVLHENVVMPEQTPGGLTGKESAVGPLMFQGNHGPVAYRNIMVTPLGTAEK